MKVCPICGNTVADKEIECKCCGYTIKTSVNAVSETVNSPQVVVNKPPKSTSKKLSKKVIIPIIAVLVVVIGLGATLLYGRIIHGKEIELTFSSRAVEGSSYKTVKAKFEKMGFDNITLVEDDDISRIDSVLLNGLVEEVTIDGDRRFRSGDVYYEHSEIVITYYAR